jgi:hypothetical protein
MAENPSIGSSGFVVEFGGSIRLPLVHNAILAVRAQVAAAEIYLRQAGFA